MSNKIYLLIAILISWITLGSLIYEKKCYTRNVTRQAISVKKRSYFHGISLRDKDLFSVHVKDNFIFYKSTSGYLLPLSDSLNAALLITADYIKKNPQKKLKLICRYNPIESSKNSIDWGLLRAKEIEQLFISKGVPANQLITTSLKDKMLPIINNRIFGGFIPIIINQ